MKKSVRFQWDLNNKNFNAMLEPLPDHPIDECYYMGAVFFGNFKLEFVRNDVAGIYCNLFEYAAEDDPDHAYGYLEDGTPYEERYPISDEINTPDLNTLVRRPSFTEFAEGIERQINEMLNRHPEFIESASVNMDPNNWYPCNHSYHIKEFSRTA